MAVVQVYYSDMLPEAQPRKNGFLCTLLQWTNYRVHPTCT